MSDNPLAEVHAALHLAWHAATYKDCRRYVEAALVALRYIEQGGGVTAVTPLICAQVLEEAALVADEEYRLQISLTEPTAAFTAEAIATTIRALKPAAPPPSDASA